MLASKDKTTLKQLIEADPHISEENKLDLIQKIDNGDEDSELLHGIEGAGAGLIAAKFLQLSRNSQILLTIAGYGIGKYLLDNSKNNDKVMQYNDKLKRYNLHL
jgi:hypothetical protein